MDYHSVEQAGFRMEFGTLAHLPTMKLLLIKRLDSPSKKIFIRQRTMQRSIVDIIYIIASIEINIDQYLKIDKIPVGTGVHQGDTKSPKLFTVGLEEAFKDMD